MSTLNWIGKEAVIKHDEDVPFRLLTPVVSESLSDGNVRDEANMILEGDNLDALKALLPRYAGEIKCIYIDPPYNTGREEWRYNDNVNSKEIKKWLGEVVGKETEDLSRHDKWLCMMYPRLLLLKKLLRDDGVLFISIGDDEVAALEMIGREIFGTKNLLAKFVWNTEGNTDNQLEVKVNHEYVLMFLKNFNQKDKAVGYVVDPNTREDSNLWKGIADNNINKNNPANPPAIFEIPAGFPSAEESLFYPAKKVDERFFEQTSSDAVISKAIAEEYGIENKSGLPVKLDDLVVENFQVTKPCRVYGGFANRRKLEGFVANGLAPIDDGQGTLRFYLNKNAAIRYRRESGASRNILSVLRNLGTTERMRTELRGMGVEFDYPKPVDLVKYLLSFGAQDQDSIVLDSFAGSGTTAHALLKLNQEDGGNRKFILVEMLPDVAKSVTAERIRKVSKGYTDSKGKNVDGLGGAFQYCELSEVPIFEPDGQVREDIEYSALAEFVWFVETGSGFGEPTGSSLIGVYKGRAVYLLYNGILGDRSVQGGNVLTQKILSSLPDFDGPKVIYAAANRMSPAQCNKRKIVFKQTPYALDV